MRQFNSFGAFANHLRRLQATRTTMIAYVAREIGEMVAYSAKERIGHYNAAAGGFAGWAPLKESTEQHKAALGYPLNSPLLAAGEMRESIGSIVQLRFRGATVLVGSNDEKIGYHEFGTEKIPPRPVLGPAMFEAKRGITRAAGSALFAWMAGLDWRRG